MQDEAGTTEAGQAIYTRRNLALYDLVVLRISNRFIWRCPTPLLVEHYNRHISANHLDIGVGTGYFLDHCRFPMDRPRLVLFDLNVNSLAHTAHRVQRYRPETHQVDVMQPLTMDVAPFASIAINYLLHCLPGPMTHKAQVFDHLLPLMAPGAVIFGSTILHADVSRSPLARRLMAFYNAKGIFDNERDGLEMLNAALERRFQQVMLSVEGCVARFAVSSPRQDGDRQRPAADQA